MTEAFLQENIDSLEGTARYAGLFLKKMLKGHGRWISSESLVELNSVPNI